MTRRAKVEVQFLGPIRRPWPERSRTVEIEGGTSVHDFLLEVGFAEKELKRIVIIYNGKRSKTSAVLNDGDSLAVGLPVGGG